MKFNGIILNPKKEQKHNKKRTKTIFRNIFSLNKEQ